jgi:hypothetical protein
MADENRILLSNLAGIPRTRVEGAAKRPRKAQKNASTDIAGNENAYPVGAEQAFVDL